MKTSTLLAALCISACNGQNVERSEATKESRPEVLVEPCSMPTPAALVPAGIPAPHDGPSGAATLEIDGKLVQGALVVAKLPKGAKVKRATLPGHRLHFDAEGAFAVAFARTAPKKETLDITLEDGRIVHHVFEVAQRTYELEEIDGLPKDMVEPDGDAKRAKSASERAISAARMKRTDGDCWKLGFAWPATGKITSRYGQPRKLNGKDGGIHWGVDIAVPVGTKVLAPACGTVVFAEANVPLSGGTMVIDHGNGVTSTFLHLSSFTKKVGETVVQNEIVARSGATGRATGPHLDWRMNYLDVRIDPELVAPPMPAK